MAFAHRRRAFVAALIAGLALSACSPGSQGAPGDQPVLRVGSQKGAAKALVLASGVLEGAPYKVVWSEFPAAQHLLEALGAGAVDLGAVGDAPFLFAYSGGSKIKVVQVVRSSAGGAATALVVAKDSPIRTAADLKGKRIATGRGSIGHYLLLAILDRAGLKPADVEVVFFAPGDAKAAFSTGAVDAWVIWGPYLGVATLDDHARVIADGTGLLSGYAFHVASESAIAAKRPQLEDFLRRLAKAQAWSVGHQGEYAAVMAKETGLAPRIATYTVEHNLTQPAPIDGAVIAEERQVLARFQSAGAITARPDVEAAFDPSFNKALQP